MKLDLSDWIKPVNLPDLGLVAAGNPWHCPPGDNGGRFTDQDASHCSSPVTHEHLLINKEIAQAEPFSEEWQRLYDRRQAISSPEQLAYLITLTDDRLEGALTDGPVPVPDGYVSLFDGAVVIPEDPQAAWEEMKQTQLPQLHQVNDLALLKLPQQWKDATFGQRNPDSSVYDERFDGMDDDEIWLELLGDVRKYNTSTLEPGRFTPLEQKLIDDLKANQLGSSWEARLRDRPPIPSGWGAVQSGYLTPVDVIHEDGTGTFAEPVHPDLMDAMGWKIDPAGIKPSLADGPYVTLNIDEVLPRLRADAAAANALRPNLQSYEAVEEVADNSPAVKEFLAEFYGPMVETPLTASEMEPHATELVRLFEAEVGAPLTDVETSLVLNKFNLGKSAPMTASELNRTLEPARLLEEWEGQSLVDEALAEAWGEEPWAPPSQAGVLKRLADHDPNEPLPPDLVHQLWGKSSPYSGGDAWTGAVATFAGGTDYEMKVLDRELKFRHTAALYDIEPELRSLPDLDGVRSWDPTSTVFGPDVWASDNDPVFTPYDDERRANRELNEMQHLVSNARLAKILPPPTGVETPAQLYKIQTMSNEDFAEDMRKGWVSSARSAKSLALQAEVGNVTGDLSGYESQLTRTGYDPDSRYMPRMRGYAEAVYGTTQRHLEDLGIEQVSVSRGTNITPLALARSKTIRDRILAADIPGNQAHGKGLEFTIDSHEIQRQPLSSWSIDSTIAESFSRGDWVEVVQEATVPREAVFSTGVTGPGSHYERELILLDFNGPTTVEIVVTREDQDRIRVAAELWDRYDRGGTGTPTQDDWLDAMEEMQEAAGLISSADPGLPAFIDSIDGPLDFADWMRGDPEDPDNFVDLDAELEALVAAGNPWHCPPGDNGGRFTDRDASHCDSPTTYEQNILFAVWQAAEPFTDEWAAAKADFEGALSHDPKTRMDQTLYLLAAKLVEPKPLPVREPFSVDGVPEGFASYFDGAVVVPEDRQAAWEAFQAEYVPTLKNFSFDDLKRVYDLSWSIKFDGEVDDPTAFEMIWRRQLAYKGETLNPPPRSGRKNVTVDFDALTPTEWEILHAFFGEGRAVGSGGLGVWSSWIKPGFPKPNGYVYGILDGYVSPVDFGDGSDVYGNRIGEFKLGSLRPTDPKLIEALGWKIDPDGIKPVPPEGPYVTLNVDEPLARLTAAAGAVDDVMRPNLQSYERVRELMNAGGDPYGLDKKFDEVLEHGNATNWDDESGRRVAAEVVELFEAAVEAPLTDLEKTMVLGQYHLDDYAPMSRLELLDTLEPNDLLDDWYGADGQRSPQAQTLEELTTHDPSEPLPTKLIERLWAGGMENWTEGKYLFAKGTPYEMGVSHQELKYRHAMATYDIEPGSLPMPDLAALNSAAFGEGPPDYMAEFSIFDRYDGARVGNDGLTEMQHRVSNARIAEIIDDPGPTPATATTERFAEAVRKGWVTSARGQKSLALQKYVAHETGDLSGFELQLERSSPGYAIGYAEPGWGHEGDMGPYVDRLPAYAEAVYGTTQQHFKDLNIETVGVHRGTVLSAMHLARSDALREKILATPLKEGYDNEPLATRFEIDSHEIQRQPLSSWTVAESVADSFSSANEETEFGMIQRAIVPREAVFSTGVTGPGSHYERELILFDFNGPTTVEVKVTRHLKDQIAKAQGIWERFDNGEIVPNHEWQDMGYPIPSVEDTPQIPDYPGHVLEDEYDATSGVTASANPELSVAWFGFGGPPDFTDWLRGDPNDPDNFVDLDAELEALVAAGNPWHCPPGDNGGRFTDRDASHCFSPVTVEQIEVFDRYRALEPLSDEAQGAYQEVLESLSHNRRIKGQQLAYLFTSTKAKVEPTTPGEFYDAVEAGRTRHLEALQRLHSVQLHNLKLALAEIDVAAEEWFGAVDAYDEAFVEGDPLWEALEDRLMVPRVRDEIGAIREAFGDPPYIDDEFVHYGAHNRLVGEYLELNDAAYAGEMDVTIGAYQKFGDYMPTADNWRHDEVFLGNQEYEPGFDFWGLTPDDPWLEGEGGGIVVDPDAVKANLRDRVLRRLKIDDWAADEQLVAQHGLTVTELDELLAKELTAQTKAVVADPGRIMVRAPEDVIEQILTDGFFESQFTSRHSRGTADLHVRNLVEGRQMGVPDRPPHRPIYGYADWADEEHYSEGRVDYFGDVAFVLDDSVKSRSTLTFGDSFRGMPAFRVGHHELDDDDWYLGSHGEQGPLVESAARSVAEKLNGGPTDPYMRVQSTYVEAHIHGGLTVEDVAEIRLAEYVEDDVRDRVHALAEKHGIPIGEPIKPEPTVEELDVIYQEHQAKKATA